MGKATAPYRVTATGAFTRKGARILSGRPATRVACSKTKLVCVPATVLRAGVAGTNAPAMALGLGVNVTILGINVGRLRELDALYSGRLNTVASNSYEVNAQ